MVASTWPAFTVLPAFTARLCSLAVLLIRSKARSALSTASSAPTTLIFALKLPRCAVTTCVRLALVAAAVDEAL